MRILTVGGGSGGHVTPVAAVIQEIKKSHPSAEIRFWCDRKFYKNARSIFDNSDLKTIPINVISAGKLRRYYHLTVLQQVTWPSLVIKNIIDFFLVVAGFFQSLFKLILWRPDVVFTKGGYVCLPVGFAAKLLGIPIVIHDSDAHPGLTNRILSKWARVITTGAPLEYYPYDKNKSYYVGIPISKDFYRFSKQDKLKALEKWGINQKYPLVLITGGGLGASRINNAVVSSLRDLLKVCSIVLVSGNNQYEEIRAQVPSNDDRFQLYEFISRDIASLMGAADIVITRAGATTALELSALGKPTVFIPNAKLTGGHQLKNASVYSDAGAALIIDEEDLVSNSKILVETIKNLLDNPKDMADMAKRFAQFAKPNAAKRVADVIVKAIQ